MILGRRHGLCAIGIVAALALRIAAAASAQPGAAPDETQPYALRAYQLGMTLDEFRRTPHPDQEEWPDAYAVCSDDGRIAEGRYESARIDPRLAGAGVVRCRLFFDEPGIIASTWPAGLLLGARVAMPDFYFVRPDPDDAPRLYWIRTRGPTEDFAEALRFLVETLGEPAIRRTELWRSDTGAAARISVLRWRNTAAYVDLREVEVGDVFELHHRLRALNELVSERLRPARR